MSLLFNNSIFLPLERLPPSRFFSTQQPWTATPYLIACSQLLFNSTITRPAHVAVGSEPSLTSVPPASRCSATAVEPTHLSSSLTRPRLQRTLFLPGLPQQAILNPNPLDTASPPNRRAAPSMTGKFIPQRRTTSSPLQPLTQAFFVFRLHWH